MNHNATSKLLNLYRYLSDLGFYVEAKECFGILKTAMPMINEEYVSPVKIYGDFG